MVIEIASGLVSVRSWERGRMGRSRGRPSAVFCWGRCEAFQGGGALSRPISGIDKLIPESSFRSIPSLRSTAAVRTACCGHGHGHGHFEASCYSWRYRCGNLSCFLNDSQLELFLHLTELQQKKSRGQHHHPSLRLTDTGSLKTLAKTSRPCITTTHADGGLRGRHRCLRANHRRSAEAVQVTSGA